jgi:tRNA threonylcarbamoyladenosine biosynthesis protein TsaB
MRILGIDTSMPIASAAIVENGELLAEQTRGPMTDGRIGNHAEAVLPLIQSVLTNTRTDPDELGAIGVTIGPGSFTGVRIGLATATGLAYPSNLALIGVSTLHACAARVREFAGLIGAVLDARKREVYVALFRRSRDDLIRLTPDAALSLQAAITLVGEQRKGGEPVVLIGGGARAYEGDFSAAIDAVRITDGAGYPTVASQTALLAAGRFDDAALAPWSNIAPVYLQATEAESRRRKPPNLLHS